MCSNSTDVLKQNVITLRCKQSDSFGLNDRIECSLCSIWVYEMLIKSQSTCNPLPASLFDFCQVNSILILKSF